MVGSLAGTKSPVCSETCFILVESRIVINPAVRFLNLTSMKTLHAGIKNVVEDSDPLAMGGPAK